MENEYFKDLEKIKKTIIENRNKAMVVVNSAMIMTYYKIGKIINQRKEWGNKYIHKLADDLKNVSNGYSFDQLMKISQFASIFNIDEIRSQPVTQIPWGTLSRVIIPKSSNKAEMLWYINQTYKNKWSRRIVEVQFSLKAYERSLIEPEESNPCEEDENIEEIYKDTYVFDFLDKNDVKYEKDLKKKLVDNVIQFLEELGPGFSLLRKEYRLEVPGGDEFFIDLLMYHVKIHAYVVIEVKIGKFTPSDLGQLQFYVNAIDDLEKTEIDNPTIGLLLCKDANSYVAKTSLRGTMNKIGISKYKLIDELPEYLERRLNEIKEG